MKNNLLTDKLSYTGESETPTHFHLCSYNGKDLQEMSGKQFDKIQDQITDGRFHWLQIHGMKNTETIRTICAYFQIDFLTMQDILNFKHPSKIEERENYNVVISKISSLTDHSDEVDQIHVCLIQGKNFVLTFLEEETPFFEDVRQALNNNVLRIRERTPDFLLSVLLNSLASNYLSVISAIDNALEELESELLNTSSNQDIGIQIRLLRKQYLQIKQTVYPLKEQHTKLLRSESPLLSKANRAFFSDVSDHILYATQMIDTCRETLSSLMDLYISNNDLHMNDIMTRLTIVSTIFIPLTFLVGVWGMNFKWMPELDWRYGYAFAWGVMIVIGAATSIYLKKKKWNDKKK